jgi:hypothetical protein
MKNSDIGWMMTGANVEVGGIIHGNTIKDRDPTARLQIRATIVNGPTIIQRSRFDSRRHT